MTVPYNPENVAILAHGKNWELPTPEDPQQIELSIDSSMTAEAAGLLYVAGKAGKIIMSTGQTAGPEYPSEAFAMVSAMRRRFGEDVIPPEDVIMEEESYDTVTNVARVKQLCAEHDLDGVILLTVGYHLPRVKRLARLGGLSVVDSYRSNQVVGEDRGISHHYYGRTVLRSAAARRSFRPLVRTSSAYALEVMGAANSFRDSSGADWLSQIATKQLRHQ